MWRRLLILALCVMPALWADVCDGLPTAGIPFYQRTSKGPPKGSELFGSNEPLSFKLSVKSGGPTFRITVRPIWQIKADDGIGESAAQRSGFAPRGGIVDDTHAGDIEVARCQDGKRLQVLPIMADQPLSFGSTFHADDINFDGYLDFSVVCEFAASADRRCYWVYDPGSQLFVQNELTHELAGWWGFNEVNPAKHEITRHFPVTAMAGCPNSVEREEERYRVNNNHLLLIHKQQTMREPQRCTVTESDLIGGTMHVTKVRRFDAQGQPVK